MIESSIRSMDEISRNGNETQRSNRARVDMGWIDRKLAVQSSPVTSSSQTSQITNTYHLIHLSSHPFYPFSIRCLRFSPNESLRRPRAHSLSPSDIVPYLVYKLPEAFTPSTLLLCDWQGFLLIGIARACVGSSMSHCYFSPQPPIELPFHVN